MRAGFCFGIAATLLSLAIPAASAEQARLRLIGEQRIPHRLVFDGTVVGGLSGIDYDARSDTWVMASDDRSEFSPARFYTARLDYDATQFRAIKLEAVHLFRQADGSTYPAQQGEVADIEAVRVDPQDGSIWYASEGSGSLGLSPFVRRAAADGSYRVALPMPDLFKDDPGHQRGPRNNLSVEGLSFAPDGQSLWLGMEAPLYQDGPVATQEHGAVSRLTQFARSGKVLAQYAYPVDRVQGVPAAGHFGDNGVSEILVFDTYHLLVLERSGVQDAAGHFTFHIRLYMVELDGATNVGGYPALTGVDYQPLRKQLLLNFDSAGLNKVDNLEGMSWGPLLPNGHRSLVLVSDDNFSDDQVTQLLAFELLPASD
ncbi:esterase-like activity of phytase family protein [Duganella sp. FT50W]|uniref:Esterase-like activity of phytase family protein n=1 Tax=Duganella lactea TaxID=2692173 RepID=A0A6L8MQB2_9BURK|nr:esterase-like activity of phytase family protein [Duganella lactea]MYM83665.1 esterase-like activity of phytase family protein [Duganella lactea]